MLTRCKSGIIKTSYLKFDFVLIYSLQIVLALFAATGDFNEMEAKLGLNRPVNLADLFGKHNLVKFLNHLARLCFPKRLEKFTVRFRLSLASTLLKSPVAANDVIMIL